MLLRCAGGGAAPERSQAAPTQDDAGAAPPPVDAAVICDGTTDIVFAYFMQGEPGREDEAAVAWELGHAYLYVDGRCRYWVRTADAFTDTRAGQLTDGDMRRLATDLHYSEWSDYAGSWDAPALDANWFVFYDRSVAFACKAGCPGAQACSSRLSLGCESCESGLVSRRILILERGPRPQLATRLFDGRLQCRIGALVVARLVREPLFEHLRRGFPPSATFFVGHIHVC
jgi:hypothetical protein